MTFVLGQSSGGITGGLKPQSGCCHGLNGRASCLNIPAEGTPDPSAEAPSSVRQGASTQQGLLHPPQGLGHQLQPVALIKRLFQTISSNNNKTPNRNNKTVDSRRIKMGTCLSATPRGQFGAQAGGTIFTSNRHVSSRHRLGRDGFRERDHPVPGTQVPPGHFGDPHKEGFSCVSQPPSWESVSPSCPPTQPNTKPTGPATKI